tara:strand:+ start:31 stop:576 length:546 start_codon:yes stop_codon:yes gene_type:complete
MIEDPLYLPKTTKVFIICDPYNELQMTRKNMLVEQADIHGYETRTQYINKNSLGQPATQESITKNMGFFIDLPASVIGTYALLEWYAYLSILRKGRILKDNFVILHAETSDFKNDILLTDMKYPCPYINHLQGLVMNSIFAEKILARFNTIFSQIYNSELVINPKYSVQKAMANHGQGNRL